MKDTNDIPANDVVGFGNIAVTGVVVERSIDAFGPISFDHEQNRMTFHSGKYVLHKPVTVGMFEGMVVEGIEQQSTGTDAD